MDAKGALLRRAFWTAIVLGLVVRLVVFTQTSALGTPIVDEQHYSLLATNLLDGHGFAWGPGQLTSIRPPLYPAVVAGIWRLTGAGNLQAVRLCQNPDVGHHDPADVSARQACLWRTRGPGGGCRVLAISVADSISTSRF
jgi:hypothetical protein